MIFEMVRDGVRRSLADSTTGTYTAWDADGNIVETRPLTPAEVASFAAAQAVEDASSNRQSLEGKLTAWRQANAVFLGLDDAQRAAGSQHQVVRLTRQCNALIRLTLQQLDSGNDA